MVQSQKHCSKENIRYSVTNPYSILVFVYFIKFMLNKYISTFCMNVNIPFDPRNEFKV